MPDEWIKITYKGKSITARKQDLGPERVEDRLRRLERERMRDIRPPLAESLGFCTDPTVTFPKEKDA